MVHVLVPPSTGGEGKAFAPGTRYSETMRCVQYDTFSDRYGRHIAEEVLPHAAREIKLRTDAYSRGTAGASSGGLSAFKLAWFHPHEFSRVHSIIGSFTDVYWDGDPNLGGSIAATRVRRDPTRNIRVWMSDGTNDLELPVRSDQEAWGAGSWPLNNVMLANALKGSGYDFHFRFGEGYHGFGQGALDLPESLTWLWRDYDPERTEQVFEQDEAERSQPMYRVGITNREAR
jgi:enterochelin esterase family protein